LPALDGHTNHRMFADEVTEYSLIYLSNNVDNVCLKWPFRNLLIQRDQLRPLDYRFPGETFPNFLATPGIAYVSYHFEVAFGTQFALNSPSVAGNHAGVVGPLDNYYDSIFSTAGNGTIESRICG
jgi:hypothetical protein